MINQTFDGNDIKEVEVLITTFSDKKENPENHITITLKNGQVFMYVTFLSSFVIIEGEKRSEPPNLCKDCNGWICGPLKCGKNE